MTSHVEMKTILSNFCDTTEILQNELFYLYHIDYKGPLENSHKTFGAPSVVKCSGENLCNDSNAM